MNGVIDMTRKELKEATARYLSDGGKITKLPDGPIFKVPSYGVAVKPSNKVDFTALEDPTSKAQIEALEKATV
jgi:hypothetical protein